VSYHVICLTSNNINNFFFFVLQVSYRPEFRCLSLYLDTRPTYHRNIGHACSDISLSKYNNGDNNAIIRHAYTININHYVNFFFDISGVYAVEAVDDAQCNSRRTDKIIVLVMYCNILLLNNYIK